MIASGIPISWIPDKIISNAYTLTKTNPFSLFSGTWNPQLHFWSLLPLTLSLLPQVTQRLLTFDSVGRPLKCDHSLESHRVVHHSGAVCFSIFPSLNLALSGVKGLTFHPMKNLTIHSSDRSLSLTIPAC